MKTWLVWSTVIENLGIFMFVLTVRVKYWLILCFWNIFPFFCRSLAVVVRAIFKMIFAYQGEVVMSLLLPLWDLGGLNCRRHPKKTKADTPRIVRSPIVRSGKALNPLLGGSHYARPPRNFFSLIGNDRETLTYSGHWLGCRRGPF